MIAVAGIPAFDVPFLFLSKAGFYSLLIVELFTKYENPVLYLM
jgi:hypothetical protein